MKLCVAGRAERDQIVRRVAACLSAFQVMYVQLDRFLLRGSGPAALTGVIVPVKDILPDVVLVVHLTVLVVLSFGEWFPFQIGFQPLRIELCCLNTNAGNRQNPHYEGDTL